MNVSQVAAGRTYTLAIRDAIAVAKAGDPLRAVRVIVPSNIAGLSLRRMLGSSLLSDGGPLLATAGIANVSFSTPFQFASLLAAPSLAASGQRPLTTPVLAAAVRHVLSTEPGRFGAVAEHVATETALIRAYGEITEMPPAQRRALSEKASGRTQDLLRFVEAVGEHLQSGSSLRFHDEYAVLFAAATAIEKRPIPETILLAGPFGQGLAVVEFLQAVVKYLPTGAVFSLTGDHEVDEASRAQAERILAQPVQTASVPRPTPTQMLPTADPDEEVRAVVRQVLSAAERGVRFDRMAVFVPVRAPYLRSIREQFEQADIPSAGPDHRTLGDSMVGRLLLRLLSLADSALAIAHDKRFDREGVLALVEAAPLRGPDGRRIRSGPWENISRSAGVVSGIDDWTARLGTHEVSLTKRLDDDRADLSSGARSGFERERAAAIELRTFVEWLADLTEPQRVGRSWSERAAWAREALEALLPQENRRSVWPDTEIEAAERVDKILTRVAVLDEIEPNLNSSAFLRAIQLELDAPAGRRGRFGTGVLVAPLASAVGLDLDEVFILGMAEGICPRPIREDTLLPDSERAHSNGGLVSRVDRNREERQRYLQALASGDVAATLVFPTGDHRSGRERTVSRWWVEAVRDRTGDPSINSKTWSETSLFDDISFGSFQEALTAAVDDGMATSAADLQLHLVHAGQLQGLDPLADDAPIQLNASLRRGLDLTVSRLSGFNRFTGDLAATDVPQVVADDKAISPSRLESWAKCPRRYFFEQLLRLGEIERPEEIAEISAMDRGNLYHQILEDFIAGSLPGEEHAFDSPDYRWTDEDRARLFATAEKRYDEYEALGRTGRPILWAIKREETTADLDAFLRSDNEMRAERRSLPNNVEMAFGLPDRTSGVEEPAALVSLPDGRTLRLRGFIDRLDIRTVDGVPVVHDYKTGGFRGQEQKKFDEDPVLGGTKLQLGVYAEAARQRFETDEAQAYYWFTSAKGGFKRVGYSWTDERSARFTEAVETIVDGIERGDFPPNPGDLDQFFGEFKNCSFCPFTRICPVDRDEELEQAIKSGRLVDYVAMHQPSEVA
ncbi:MAG: ATP-dependent helicase/nuclease subunit B [Verrucomicrobiales bacterium]|jgi:ATP-dependent helicase/nuclease subunit B